MVCTCICPIHNIHIPIHNVDTQLFRSKLASSPANRKAFIDSLEVFMTKYGFQGVDIDWEYPVEPNRGGDPLDTQNLVSLMAEMRAKFGSRFGISMTLAPDYWYLRYFDAKAMESSVDFFGFMAYGS